MFFFFQAEDGIRDLVRSRGLGDVYKRQQNYGLQRHAALHLANELRVPGPSGVEMTDFVKTPVSYTHLTLPTSDLV